MAIKTLWTGIAAALLTAVAVTQTPAPTMSAEALVQWLDGRATGYSGSVLIARGDQVLVERAYGDADRRGNRKNTPATRFNLGSINKTFTAVGIAQMIDAGKLSLDDTLAKVLPEYPNRDAAAKITLRDIIAHRSGIASFMRAEFGDVAVAEMVRRVAAEPQAFAPGTQQQYSNGGYIALGRVLEVASGEPYETYIREHIYKPAGMTGAGFLTDSDSATAALGYYGVDANGQPMMGPNPVGYVANRITKGNPAGGGYATATDLFEFSRALKSGRLLSARMTEFVCNGSFAGDPATRFGFALREQAAGAKRFIGNGGGAPGVNAEFRFEPGGEYTIVALSNVSPPSATQMLSDILANVAPGADSPAAAPTIRLRGPDGQTITERGGPSGASTQPPTVRPERIALEREIAGLHSDMIAAYRNTPETVARFYTPTAQILGGGRRFAGEQISGYWRATPPGASWALEVLDFGGLADEPWLLGRSTFERDGRQMATDYLAILRRGVDGKLRYHIDMFTSRPGI